MIKSFFKFFLYIHQQGAECGFISAVILSFFRRSSTFISTIRTATKTNSRADINPESSRLLICTDG
jgi:hypothetical protein